MKAKEVVFKYLGNNPKNNRRISPPTLDMQLPILKPYVLVLSIHVKFSGIPF